MQPQTELEKIAYRHWIRAIERHDTRPMWCVAADVAREVEDRTIQRFADQVQSPDEWLRTQKRT